MKNSKSIFSLLLSITMIFMLLPVTISNSVYAAETSGSVRYAVIILDSSGSMDGEPAVAQKEAAKRFCTSLLGATGDNYIAIVRIASTSQLDCDFTNDIDALYSIIERIPANSGTNIEGAFVIADKLLEDISEENAIKNVVLCSDGLPESGKTSYDGPFTSSDDSYYYAYANAAYNTAKLLKEKYNLYSLGFFHSLRGSELLFGQKFMEEIQNAGNYIVTDPNDLEFTFGEIANDITSDETQARLFARFISDHIEYYQSSFSDEIVPMKSTQGLGFMQEDASGDLSDAFYASLSFAVADASFISSLLSPSSYFDVNWGKSFTFKVPDVSVLDIGSSEYSVILYQLMASDNVYQGILDTFSMNYEKNIRSYAKSLSDKSLDLAKEINTSGITLPDGTTTTSLDSAKQALQKAAQTIRTADVDSPEFSKAYSDFENLGNQFLDLNKTKVYLKDLSSVASDAFSFLGSVLGEIDSIGKAYQYMCWAESYAETSDVFKEVLNEIAENADEYVRLIPYNDRFNPKYTSPYSKASMCTGLSKAIKSFISTMDKYAKDSHEAFVSQVIDKTGDSCVNLTVGFIVNKALGGSICPELAAINGILASSKLFIDLLTGIDDEYKMALAVRSLDLIAELVIDVADSYGNTLVYSQITLNDSTFPNLPRLESSEEFKQAYTNEILRRALMFDESIKIYKNAMLLACDYGIGYEKSRLTSASKMANTVPDWWYDSGATTPWQMQASTSSIAVNLLSLQKEELMDIHCHEDGLTYDHSTGLFKYNGTRKVISIACPVDVTILNSKGSQIAYLSNGSSVVEHGYEPYFFITKLEDSDDYVKVAVIPDKEDYQILINGTDTGKMTVFVGRYNGNKVTEVETFANCEITDKTKGYIESGDDNNSLGYLVIDNITIGADSIVTFSDVPKGVYYEDAVKWAIKNEVTKGTSSTTFSPNMNVTRGQAVTFLWRAMGMPESGITTNQFSDVSRSAWYYEAVLWAVEQGITYGTSAKTFSPNENVTRGQMVTFLYRTMGEPGKTGTGTWYHDAENWANREGLLIGTSVAYSTNGDCPRSDVVYYLWKELSEDRDPIAPTDAEIVDSGTFDSTQHIPTYSLSTGESTMTDYYNGENSWLLYRDGTLVVGGSGYLAGGDPWKEYKGQIKRVIIEDEVKGIASQIFAFCDNMELIEIGSSVSVVDEYAFGSCPSLSRIEVSKLNPHFKSIDGILFTKDSTTLVRYPISKYGKSYDIPNGVKHIESMAFDSCKYLESIKIPNTVLDISSYAFAYNDKLREIEIPESVTMLGDRYGNGSIFCDCSNLERIVIPGSVSVIQQHTFSGCSSLSSVTIKDGVTSIRFQAFKDCQNLTSIDIPASITSIGEGAFSACRNLQDINFSGSQAQWDNISIESDNQYFNAATVHYNS